MFEEGVDGSWGDDGVAGVNGADSCQQEFRFGTLEHIPAGPGLHRLDHGPVPVERGQRHDLWLIGAGRRGVLHDPPGGLDAIQDRHPQVHQQDVRTPFGCQGHRLFPVARPGHRSGTPIPVDNIIEIPSPGGTLSTGFTTSCPALPSPRA
jgi:hypothetical protein